MTENEALKYLNHMLQMMADEPPENIKNERDIKEWEDEHRKIKETFEISKNALEEIQEYRAIGLTPKMVKEMIESEKQASIQAIFRGAELELYQQIGTIEEFKALKEKNTPKKISYQIGKNGLKHEKCPTCGSFNVFGKHCTECGQAVDYD